MPYKDPEAQRQFQREWSASNRVPSRQAQIRRKAVQDRKERLNALKAGRPCIDCGGVFPPVAMDFDHAPGTKSHGIAEMVGGGWKWERIEDEIAKCELVCANCHRVRTHARL